MRPNLIAILILLTFFLLSLVTTAFAQTNTQYFESSFENEVLPAPLECGQGMYVPVNWTDADVGDGGIGTEMWYINASDSRAPSGGFPDGSHGIYGINTPDPDWSTENFLMQRLDDASPSLYVSWYQMFKELPSGKDIWLPIFWDYVRKDNVSNGQIIQYTVATIRVILVENQTTIAVSPDTHLNLTGALITPFALKPMQWYHFEFWHMSNETAGEITFKINDLTVFNFTGDTAAKTLSQDTVFSAIQGFEVGMQKPAIVSSNTYNFWLDNVVAKFEVMPESLIDDSGYDMIWPVLILVVLILSALIINVIARKRKWTQKINGTHFFSGPPPFCQKK